MSAVPIEPALFPTTPSHSSSSSFVQSPQRSLCLGDMRGVRWRIDLGILPSSLTSSMVDLRRATADLRRNYAAIRRQLLIDPHVFKDRSNSPDLVMDNPLSQNPDSIWGRFFKNAELERMVDQDLSRLYPEDGSYFQTPGCQAMLRRILLLWCLGHPGYGYRQGMHELLAPLLYVLHVDIEHLSEVRNLYEDHFTDNFDGFSFHKNDLTYKFDSKKFSESLGEEDKSVKTPVKTSSLGELDPKIQSVVLLNDAYGAEGELGVLLSLKFMEHDAYCMFDALMSGAGGAVAMAEFFSPSPYGNSQTGLPTVIEASAALYHLLSQVDSSLHSHLVELGIEPQYFALRWFRVLFGREFALEDLLIIWDEIFGCENMKLENSTESQGDFGCIVLNSSRGAFISAFAVSMILNVRSSLLATENATACLQKLLNFPEDIDLEKLIAKAKSLQSLAVDANKSTPFLSYDGIYQRSRSTAVRGHSHSLDLTTTPLNLLAETYWEEKWRVLHKEEENRKCIERTQVPAHKKSWSEKVKMRLSRTESDPAPSTVDGVREVPKLAVRRSLLKDLARQLGSDGDKYNLVHEENAGQRDLVDANGQDRGNIDFTCASEKCFSAKTSSQRDSSSSSDPPSPISDNNHQEIGSDRSSVASNSSVGDNNVEASRANLEGSPLPPEGFFVKPEQIDESGGNSTAFSKERKFLSGKFNWFWKFGRNTGEGTSGKYSGSEVAKALPDANSQNNLAASSTTHEYDCKGTSKGESIDHNLLISLKHLGSSMLENIQVIEQVFHQDESQVGPLENLSKSVLAGKGQAMAALKELRNISNLLSKM
ncbi:unnamed protein product [Cuscuta epithymum]|uniref:Rab-GAP TBC domain-containing protein n=1 Tax=Cuscuta epithymum TaxID=186058 RepID=A0AAV0C7X0_9ASTE|nr:unnamed protein product [Cuscuta epithymum]